MRTWLLTLAPLMLVGLRSAPTDAPRGPSDGRPNVVFLFADDQRVDTIGAWGNVAIETPHLDGLVERGVSLRRAYCLGSAHGAVCAPSRAMLHTGMAYHAIDHRSMEGRRTLGERLGEAGYSTFAAGKWHNGRDSFTRSFERGGTVMFGGMADHAAVSVVDMDERGTFSESRVAEGHSTDAFAAAAISYLASAPADAPLFCYVAFTAPHDPRDPPAEWREGRERPALPANFLTQHPFDNGFLKVRDEKLAGWPRDPDVVREQLAEYYGLIEHLDAAIGRILDAARARDDGRPTLVVYAADHGLALGSHGLLGKQSVYEHSLRAPVILAGDGLPEGLHLTALTYLHDLYPTILGVAGVPVDDDLHGRDLRPLWEGEIAEVRDSLFLSMGRTQRAVTDGRFKLCVYPRVGHRQLFDLAADPDERIDLAGRPAFQHHVRRLRRELDVWRAVVGDTDPLAVDEPKPLHVDLSGAERKPDRWQPEWIREKYFDPPAEPQEGDSEGDSGGDSEGESATESATGHNGRR
ncbi:MAG: sulfatase-like hydrolase/transferase [Planctomycetota bacterium]